MTLRFAHEVRSETDYFSDIPEMKLPTEMMKFAQHIIKTPSVVVARAAASAKAARETLLGRSRSGARMPSPIRAAVLPVSTLRRVIPLRLLHRRARADHDR